LRTDSSGRQIAQLIEAADQIDRVAQGKPKN
jgi:hypothetical protein